MDDFLTAAKRIVDDYLEHQPVQATLAGLHEHDHRLPDLSADGFHDADLRAKAYLATLDRFPADALTAQDRIDRALLVAHFSTAIREYAERAPHRHDPSLYSDTAVMGVYSLVAHDVSPVADRIAAVRARLEGIPALFDAARANLVRSPSIWTEIAIEETRGGAAFLRSDVAPLCEKFPDVRAPLDRALDAFEAHAAFLEQQHASRNGMTFAIGRDLFDFKLRSEHLLPFDTEALLTFGERAVRDTIAALERTAREIDPVTSWVDLLESLRTDHPDDKELLAVYRETVTDARRFVVDRSLVTMPHDERLDVVDTPPHLRPTVPYAAYMPPGPFDAVQRGLYYVTPLNAHLSAEERAEQLLGHNRYAMLLTTVHEAYPGHHLQLVRSNETRRLVRKLFASTVLVEGWALYCEQLVLDEGMTVDPRYRLFQLKDQLWRACRVVIDVQLHTGRMTFDEAVEMLVGVAHLERPNAIGEARRYTQSPTQPMSYLTGKHQIMALREAERRRLGDRFDLRAFHDRLLSYGSVPLALIEPTFAA